MKLKELQDVIANAWDNLDLGDLREGYDEDGKPKHGEAPDMLGAFLIEEAYETFDETPDDPDGVDVHQIHAVIDILDHGIDDLERLRFALIDVESKLP